MRRHESIVKTDSHLPEDLKKTLRDNAVASNNKLRAIKDQSNQTHT